MGEAEGGIHYLDLAEVVGEGAYWRWTRVEGKGADPVWVSCALGSLQNEIS